MKLFKFLKLLVVALIAQTALMSHYAWSSTLSFSGQYGYETVSGVTIGNFDGPFLTYLDFTMNDPYDPFYNSAAISIARVTGTFSFMDAWDNKLSIPSDNFTFWGWKVLSYSIYDNNNGYESSGESLISGIAEFDIFDPKDIIYLVDGYVEGGTNIGSYTVTINDNITAVPLTAALPLFLTGLGFLGFTSRRKASVMHRHS